MKHKFFITTIFATILLCGIISVAQAHGPGWGEFRKQRQGKGRGLRQGNNNACWENLNLSEDQTAQFRKINEEYNENMEQIRDSMRQFRVRVREQLNKGTAIDEKTEEELLDQGATFWKEKERLKLRYRQRLNDLLTQEQKDKLYLCRNFRSKRKCNTPYGSEEPLEE
ncbi:MAG: Spy/CpxP family protein refolding chaperone [bacterium]